MFDTIGNFPHIFYFHLENAFLKKHVISLILKMEPLNASHCISFDFEKRMSYISHEWNV